MVEFDVLAVGERRLQAFFDDFPARLDARLYAAMERIAGRLLSAVEAAEPQRTGALRSETTSFVTKTAAAITAGVAVEAPAGDKAAHGKAAALEYGAHRSATVAEHWAIRANFWGRYSAPRAVLIEEYRRRVEIGEERYLRGPFAALRGTILADIEAAVGQAANAPP
ncbi:MAG TPA: hypothetical protein VMS01_04250 [Stellaceae bacterium]|nr:hypothetical protein [Stellaceae bacterium]